MDIYGKYKMYVNTKFPLIIVIFQSVAIDDVFHCMVYMKLQLFCPDRYIAHEQL